MGVKPKGSDDGLEELLTIYTNGSQHKITINTSF